jgi:hypothetical protein
MPKKIFENIKDNAALVNRFGLYLLTHHPATKFKREKYFAELLAKLPAYYQKNKEVYDDEEVDVDYTLTRYLSKSESNELRIFFKDGLLVVGPDSRPFSTEVENELVCMSIKGELYSYPKKNGIQHSSFNQGGYLLFAGNWHVRSGIIQKINADSGHYEPSIVALQNFVHLLNSVGCSLEAARFFFSLRTMTENPTAFNYYSKQLCETYLDQLLSKHPVVMSEVDHLVTPAKLKTIASLPYWNNKLIQLVKQSLTLPDLNTVTAAEASEDNVALTFYAGADTTYPKKFFSSVVNSTTTEDLINNSYVGGAGL